MNWESLRSPGFLYIVVVLAYFILVPFFYNQGIFYGDKNQWKLFVIFPLVAGLLTTGVVALIAHDRINWRAFFGTSVVLAFLAMFLTKLGVLQALQSALIDLVRGLG